MKYAVKKKNKYKKIDEKELNIQGYKFKPKNNTIKDITITSPKLIDSILTIKLNNLFERLLMLANDAFNSDDNPTGVAIALDEIELVKSQIRNKYFKYLKKEKLALYLKKLELIEQEMQMKAYIILGTKEEQKGKSR